MYLIRDASGRRGEDGGREVQPDHPRRKPRTASATAGPDRFVADYWTVVPQAEVEALDFEAHMASFSARPR
jgi:hypothetical protein